MVLEMFKDEVMEIEDEIRNKIVHVWIFAANCDAIPLGRGINVEIFAMRSDVSLNYKLAHHPLVA